MAKSGFIRSSVTVSGETTGCHHTCIAVFLGKTDFADADSSGQAASSVMSASLKPIA
jgi:hypothetical protein